MVMIFLLHIYLIMVSKIVSTRIFIDTLDLSTIGIVFFKSFITTKSLDGQKFEYKRCDQFVAVIIIK